MAISFTHLFRLLTVLLLSSGPVLAQQFDWVRTEPANVNFNSQMIRYPVAADAAGNVTVVGYQNNRVLTGSIIAGELGLVSYTPTGAVRYRRTLGGASAFTQLSSTRTNGLVGLGIFKDSVRLGPGVVLRSSSTSTVQFLAGFDANGTAGWALPLNQVLGSTFSVCNGFTTDAQGNIYLTCQRNNSTLDTELWRFNPIAAAPPTRLLLQSRAGRLSSVSRAANGDLYLAGSCVDPGATFGGVAATPPYSYTNYVARYTAAGRLRWVRMFEDITCGNVQVAADDHGGAYVTAPIVAAAGNMHIGPFVTARPNASGEYLLARLDTVGTWLWLRQPPTAPTGVQTVVTNALTNTLQADAQGNAVLAASLRGTVSWPNGSTTASPTLGATDAFVVCYDPAGTVRWARSGGGTLADDAHGLAQAPNGDLYLAGYSSSGALTFGTAQGGPTAATNEFFVTRLAAARPTATHLTAPADWQVAPNPAQGSTRIRFAAGAARPATIAVHDALGRLLRTVPVVADETVLPTTGLAPGLYLLQAAAGAVRYQARLVVE